MLDVDENVVNTNSVIYMTPNPDRRYTNVYSIIISPVMAAQINRPCSMSFDRFLRCQLSSIKLQLM